MTDFYSVLKTSIVRRDLRSPADRREVYDQARKAMIRKLWSFDPPLAEDEIDTRIGLFDAAVERIEGDLELAFAEADAVEARRSQRRDPRRRPAPQPPRQPLVYEGYDEEADYMPAFGGRPSSREDDYEPPARALRAREEPMPQAPRGHDERWARQEDEPEDEAARYQSELAAFRSARRGARSHAPEEGHEPYYDESALEPFYEEPAYREEADRPPAYEEPAEWRQAPPAERRAAPRRTASRWEEPSPDPMEDEDYEEDDERYASADRGTGRGPPRKTGAASRSGRRSPVRLLTVVVAGLSVVLVAFNAYVFLPLIFGSDTTASVSSAPPPKIADRVPTMEMPATAATRLVSDSATASEIPERRLDVTESLIVFDGRDPTVFEGSSGNPIQFDSDAEGGFARISSATSAAGARAVIGPGLAERLAGRTIRITLLARASVENGAAAIRFAYQSGLAISHWQGADLSSSYGSYGMIWRVPAAHTSSPRDYLLIEPGIPGDGTSTDIRSIKIDILAS